MPLYFYRVIGRIPASAPLYCYVFFTERLAESLRVPHYIAMYSWQSGWQNPCGCPTRPPPSWPRCSCVCGCWSWGCPVTSWLPSGPPSSQKWYWSLSLSVGLCQSIVSFCLLHVCPSVLPLVHFSVCPLSVCLSCFCLCVINTNVMHSHILGNYLYNVSMYLCTNLQNQRTCSCNQTMFRLSEIHHETNA